MAPICVFYLCPTRHGQKPLFRFPTKDPKRLQVWLDNCGNPKLRCLTHGALRNKQLCIDHFHKRYVYMVKNGKRTRILRSAVPNCYKCNNSSKCSLHLTVASAVQGSDSIVSSCDSDSISKSANYDGTSKLANCDGTSKPACYDNKSKSARYDSISKPASCVSVSKTASCDSVSKSASCDSTSKPASYDSVSKSASCDITSEPASYDRVSKLANCDSISKPQSSLQNPATTSLRKLPGIQVRKLQKSLEVPKIPQTSQIRVYPRAKKKEKGPEDSSQSLCRKPNDKDPLEIGECTDPLVSRPQCSCLNNQNRTNYEESTNVQTTPEKLTKQNFDKPECKKLKLTLRKTCQIIKRVRNENARLKNKMANKRLFDLNKVEFNSETAKMFTMMQLEMKKYTPWTEAQKEFSLSLYKKSSACYKYLIKNGIVLPSRNTIYNWLHRD